MDDNIKLIIEIPKEHYQELFITDNDYILDLSNVADAVKNGIPLDKVKGYIDYIRTTGMGKKKSLDFIEKYIEGLKTESEE